MSSVDRAGPVTGTFSEKFWPGLRDEERPKILGTNSGAKFWKQSKYDETQTYNLAPIIPLATLIAEWDIYNVENTAGKARRCHLVAKNSCRFHPGNLAEVFVWPHFRVRFLRSG